MGRTATFKATHLLTVRTFGVSGPTLTFACGTKASKGWESLVHLLIRHFGQHRRHGILSFLSFAFSFAYWTHWIGVVAFLTFAFTMPMEPLGISPDRASALTHEPFPLIMLSLSVGPKQVLGHCVHILSGHVY